MSGWGKIAVATRIGHRPDAVFFKAWTALLLQGLRDGDRVLTPSVEMVHHHAAESQVRGFLATDADTILFIDDDMVFKVADVHQVRDDVDCDAYGAVMGLCQSRVPPHKPVILQEEGDHFRVDFIPPPDTIVDVGIVGLAFTFIRREVLEAVRDNHEKLFTWSERGDSEDATFSMRARKLGFNLGVSTRVQIGHRVPVSIKWDFDEGGLCYESLGEKETMVKN